MNTHEAGLILTLLHHLDGSQLLDEPDLVADLLTLHDQAAATVGGSLPLDDDALCDVLTEVSQRHCDAGNYVTDYADAP